MAGLTIAEGDFATVHGRYSGGDGKTFIAVDICGCEKRKET
jgi:hypothetical protein